MVRLLALSTFALFLAVTATAAPAGPRRRAGLWGALRTLDLSGSQKASIHSIIENENPVIRRLRRQARNDRTALKTAFAAAAPDASAVGKAVLDLRQDRKNLRAERRKVLDAIRAVLTPDQKASLAGYLAGLRAFRRSG
jgi:Spy/CpxP family protein refolding chaperone